MRQCANVRGRQIILLKRWTRPCRITCQVFENIVGVPEEEKYREMLKKRQAAHAEGKRRIALDLNKNRKQLEVLQMEIEMLEKKRWREAILPAYR